MKIVFVEIQNYRKLQSCRVEIASQETILVGANNSGKTSAMDAMILFLKKNRRKSIATTDFTLSNWPHINQIGKQWIYAGEDNSDFPGTGLTRRYGDRQGYEGPILILVPATNTYPREQRS